MRILKRERESLIKYMNTRLTGAERQELYLQWGIPLETKQRKVKLAHMVWTKSNEEAHVKMSAELVARLVTLWNKNGPVSKEMFQLSFSAPQLQTERTIWSPISSLFKAL
jgi:centromeric protein E